MSQMIFGVFEKNNRLEDVLKSVILDDNYENAIIQFEEFIRSKYNKYDFSLYKIANIKNKKIEETKVFIKRGITEQKRLDFNKIKKEIEEEKELERKAEKERNLIDKIKILFKGKIINEQ